MKKEIKKILNDSFDNELIERLMNRYEDATVRFYQDDWKGTGIEAGHFIEITRRCIEQKLDGKYTPLDDTLPSFNEQVLQTYLNKDHQADDSYRKTIPRVLFSMSELRNQRGIGHESRILANKIDANYLLNSMKWILSELVRLNSQLDSDETYNLVGKVISREVPVIWDEIETPRVLEPALTYKKQTLLLLASQVRMRAKDLFHAVEYSTFSNYKGNVLRKLHEDRLIEFKEETGMCIISPEGEKKAERILRTEIAE